VRARVSAVVPVYNVAAYLEECLSSLAQQTIDDLEVVMVDDGSTDESPEIAAGFAARDDRFRLVHQENAGLGAARNTGVAHASGEFVAFVDSDDVVPRHAYELLLDALDRTGSDFASGNVRRLTPVGTPKAGFLASATARTRLRTHITRFPRLLLDRTAWNKLFRRSFWDRHEFRFPVGVFYEDIPVTLPAHYLANTVDVIEQTVYLWRMREGDDLSITQRRTESKALRDRVAAVDHVSRFLAEQGLPISKVLYDRTVLKADLGYFLDVLPIADEEFRRLFLELTNEFIDRTDKWVLEQSTAIERLKWELVRRRALPELLEVLRFADEDLGERPPLRIGRHWYGDYPFRTDDRLGIARRVFRLDDELAPVVRLDDVHWEGDRLRIEGSAYIGQLGAAERDSQTIQLVVKRAGRRALRITAEPVYRPDVTAGSAQQFASLDWSGFVATLDPDKLTRGGRWPDGTWDVAVAIRAGGLVRTTGRIESPPLEPAPVAELELADGTHVWAGLLSGPKLTIQARRRPSLVRSCFVDEGVLQLEGEAGLLPGGAPVLQVRRLFGDVARVYPLYVERSERRSFIGRIPLADLLEDADVDDRSVHLEQQADGVVWELFLAGRGGPQQVMLPETVPEATLNVQGRELVAGRARSGALTLAERHVRPVLTDAEWSPEGALRLRGVFGAPEAEYELVLAARGRGETFGSPLAHDAATGRFSAELTPEAVTVPGGDRRPLMEGQWDLLVRERGEPAGRPVGAVLDRELLERLPLSGGSGLKSFHLGVDGEAPVLAVERDLEEGERGGFAQRRLRAAFYPSLRASPLRESVVYLSFGGTAYSDSPRAVHEELVRRHAPLEHFWVVRDGAFAVPETAVPVRHGSEEYHELLARSRYVVANDHWPRWFERRTGQTCLQTWHGAPLKRLGYELADRPKAMRAYRRTLAERPENWQIVVSPSSRATPILARAFPDAGETIETGLPRTDLLLGSDRAARAEKVKHRLGVGGKRLILYAPTYRDDLEYRPGSRISPLRDLSTYRAAVARLAGYRLGHLLDLEALASALGEDDVVLFRKHRRVVETLAPEAESFVLDVSDFPDGGELLLAADVLVTDYSSLVFDFAATGRPMIFFTPDLEAYRDQLRGFSLDFESEAPGPLLRTTHEVAEALRDVAAVAAESRRRYEAFVASHCTLADGRASGRVVDQVFSW
jgi:CDP-glycerol glycerophosphotransferase